MIKDKVKRERVSREVAQVRREVLEALPVGVDLASIVIALSELAKVFTEMIIDNDGDEIE